ncbi:MAG TPA: type 4a pilus biogenesis protein PilO [Gaiellales bacterium]|nr:type 4a pilus biogenesis protein PilO [Gaiellales bacterium]
MSLTDRDRKIVFLLLPLVLVGAFWFLLLKPKRHEATKLTEQVTQAQEARDAAVSQANQLQAAKVKYASQYAEMVRLGKALPTKVDMPSLLVQLNAAARGTGIEFGSVTVGQRAAAAPIAASTGTATSAATAFGAAVQKARAANAAESSSAAASSAASNAVGTTGATGAASSSSTPTSNAATLDEVPLTFKFGGSFTDLADFFHHLKRFVHVANDKINVQGRLITIDSLKFASTTFPSIEADVSATVYLTPKNDAATTAAASTGVVGSQSAAVAAVSSSPGASSSSTSSGNATQ